MNRTPVRQARSRIHLQPPTSAPKPTKGTDRKHERDSLTKTSTTTPTRPRSRLSNRTASPTLSVNISNPRSSSRLSFTREKNSHSPYTYTSFPSSLSSSPFQSEIDENEAIFKGTKSKIPRPVRVNEPPKAKGYKIKSRKYYKYKQIETLLTHLALYYRTKQVTAQIEQSFKVVEHQMPTRYLNTSTQLTPPPSRSREDCRSTPKAIDIPKSLGNSDQQLNLAHRPITPISPAQSPPSNTGSFSPVSAYSESSSHFEEVGNCDPIKREASPLYCEEFSSSPLSSSPVASVYEHNPPHAPLPVPNTIGTVLLPIVEVSESQTGASSYPKKRKCDIVPESVASSDTSGYVSVSSFSSSRSEPGGAQLEAEPIIESRNSTPAASVANFKISDSASDILNKDKKATRPNRAMSVVSVASCSSAICHPENPSAVVTAKGEFCLAPSKITETCIGISSIASGELQRIETASKRTQTQTSISSTACDVGEVAKRADSRVWGMLSRWMGW